MSLPVSGSTLIPSRAVCAPRLQRKGVRLTRQRRVLLDVMDQAEQHLTADSILERAQKIDPRVHRVTVYRTLEMLKSHGLLDELDLLHIHGHRHYYESHGPRDHIHVACLRCGKVREVESDLFEQLKRQVERDTGIGITVARVGDRRLLRRLPPKAAASVVVARCFPQLQIPRRSPAGDMRSMSRDDNGTSGKR